MLLQQINFKSIFEVFGYTTKNIWRKIIEFSILFSKTLESPNWSSWASDISKGSWFGKFAINNNIPPLMATQP